MNRLFALIILAFPVLVQAQSPLLHEMPNRVIVKVKPEYRNLCNNNQFVQLPNLAPLLNRLAVTSAVRKYPLAEIPENKFGAGGQKMVDISLIYELQYSSSSSISEACTLLMSSGCLVYACARPLPRVLYTPSDPDTANGNQYYLKLIHAYAAWDSTKGDTNVVIGIGDTGADMDHPDLVNSIKYNYADPIDGANEDGDSINGIPLTDNFYGWDLADNDNFPGITNPNATDALHGAVLAGLAAATTNNNIGVAGVGFKCKFLPVKIMQDATGNLVSAYDDIQYEADHGCKIINCSWGDTTNPGQFGQDIVDYATINKGCLIIAASGNSNNEAVYYPAALKNVLSVSGTDMNDIKTYNSTYGSSIDVCAPSLHIYSTLYDDTYGKYCIGSACGDGTSYACAIVSGAAALVKSKYPNYTGIQVGEQLKITADQIDGLTQNATYKGKLGYGRINLFRAVTSPGLPALKLLEKNFTDPNASAYVCGDTIKLTIKLQNLLNPSKQALVVASSTSPNVRFLKNTFYIGTLATNDSIINNNNPLQLVLTGNIQPNTSIPITLTFEDFGYYETKTISFTTGNNYKNIQPNTLKTTLAESGSIGYTPKPITGNGFTYNGSVGLSSEIGFMLGADSIHLLDNIHSIANKKDSDFVEQLAVRPLGIPSVTDENYIQFFNDDSAHTKKLGLTIIQKTLAHKTTPYNKYLVLDYKIVNTSAQKIDNLFAGTYSNWDVFSVLFNKADYIDSLRLAYAYSTQKLGVYTGMQLLSPTKGNVYNMDLVAGGAGGIDATTQFTLSQKYTTLSSSRNKAGQGNNGNDIAQVVSAGPFSITPNDTAHVIIALIAGNDLNDLLKSAHLADSIYNYIDHTDIAVNHSTSGVSVYPNPSGGSVYFNINTAVPTTGLLKIFNVLGEEVYQQSLSLTQGAQIVLYKGDLLPKGIYTYQIIGNRLMAQGKLVLEKE